MLELEHLPKQVRDDLEDQSLDIVHSIQHHIVVIGGWAVRSYTAKSVKYARYTLDVDAITTKETMKTIHAILSKEHSMIPEKTDWGIKFYKPYQPHQNISCKPSLLKDIQIRIEISPPRIYDIDTDHYFEYNLEKTTKQEIISHGKHQPVLVTVPEIEYLTVNKLGLPADYKNRYDAAVLLLQSDFSKIFDIIKKTNKWSEMIRTRIPKFIGRTKDKQDIAHILLHQANISITEYIHQLQNIQQKLEQ